MDIAMNAAAASVEKKYSVTVMSACHGMWSAGGMMGAGGTAVIAGLGISPSWHILCLAAILLLVMGSLSTGLLSIKDEQKATVLFSLPTGQLLGLAIIGFCIMLSEGAIYDWSAIYLRNTLMASAFYSGLGYAGFSLTMAVGRFFGDEVIHRVGSKRVLMGGALLAASGILVVVLFKLPLVVVAGFTLAGLGYSCLIPAIYITASRMPGRIPGVSLAAVASLGYFGLLIGPPLIGILADYFGLAFGFSVVVLLLGLIFVMSKRFRF
jgi:MFS family permease